MRRLLPVLLLLLAGCSRTPATHPFTACAATASGAVSVTAALQGGKAVPAPHRVSVPLNATVEVRVSADQVVQVHVHGYDLEYDAAPGNPGCVSFVADRAGLFDVEAHPDTLLVQLEVR